MPEKAKTYEHVVYTPEVIQEAAQALRAALPGEQREVLVQRLSVKLPSGEEWKHDTEEEFFADYRKGFLEASFSQIFGDDGEIRVLVYRDSTEVKITMPTRASVEKVFEIFERNADKYRKPSIPLWWPVKPRVRIFIGHGRNQQWRDLKDHLHEKHGLGVEAYELGARASLTIRDVLDDMLTSSSFAVLVFTAEDLDAEGRLHARENVIHELGLFQGRLGWSKAIVLLEEGVEEFSNIEGINQIRFSAGHIRETFGDVVATIRREFPER